MQSLANFPGLGNTIPGTDSEDNLANENFLGGRRWFDEIDRDRSTVGPWGLDSGAWIEAVLLRNTSGSTLIGGNLGLLDQAGTAAQTLYTCVSGYGAADWEQACVLIDPWIDSTVADDDLFWGIIKGPAPGRTPQLQASFLGALAIGDGVYCTADALGRVSGPKGTPASSTEAYQQAVSKLGIACQAAADTVVSTQKLIYWNIPWAA